MFISCHVKTHFGLILISDIQWAVKPNDFFSLQFLEMDLCIWGLNWKLGLFFASVLLFISSMRITKPVKMWVRLKAPNHIFIVSPIM